MHDIVCMFVEINKKSESISSSDWMRKLSISAIESADSKLWISVIACYLFTFIAFHCLRDLYQRIALQSDSVATTNHPSHYTVILSNIPSKYQNSESLKKLFETLFPNQIAKLSQQNIVF